MRHAVHHWRRPIVRRLARHQFQWEVPVWRSTNQLRGIADGSCTTGGGSGVDPAHLQQRFILLATQLNRPMRQGLPLATFVDFLKTTEKMSQEDAQRMVENSCATVSKAEQEEQAFNGLVLDPEAQTVRLVGENKGAGASCSATTAPYYEAMSALAADINPIAGHTAQEMRNAIHQLVPEFKPQQLGALTLREALGKYPDLFVISDEGASWCVKPTNKVVSERQQKESAQAQASTGTGSTTQGNSQMVEQADDADVVDGATDGTAEVAAAEEKPTVSESEETLLSPDELGEAEKHVAGALERCTRLGLSAKEMYGTCPAAQGGGWVDLRHVDIAGVGHGAAALNRLQQLSPMVEYTQRLVVRPRQVPRPSIVFVDSSALSALECQAILGMYNIQPTSMIVARQPGASSYAAAGDSTLQPRRDRWAATPQPPSLAVLSAQAKLGALPPMPQFHELVTPTGVPVYMLLEVQALNTRRTALKPIVADIVFVCSDNNLSTYSAVVERCAQFPDACTYIASPSGMWRMTEKTSVEENIVAPLSEFAECVTDDVDTTNNSSGSSAADRELLGREEADVNAYIEAQLARSA